MIIARATERFISINGNESTGHPGPIGPRCPVSFSADRFQRNETGSLLLHPQNPNRCYATI